MTSFEDGAVEAPRPSNPLSEGKLGAGVVTLAQIENGTARVILEPDQIADRTPRVIVD